MPKRGLPDTLRMRHDAHYVETLAASAGAPVGRLVPIDQVDPNPDQPRQAMGDLAELISSVTEAMSSARSPMDWRGWSGLGSIWSIGTMRPTGAPADAARVST